MAKVSVTRDSVLGIDIGSVSLSMVQMDPEGNILRQFYQFHKGKIRNTFSEAAKVFDLAHINAIACTSSSACLNKKRVQNYNTQVAIMAAARYFCRNAASVFPDAVFAEMIRL